MRITVKSANATMTRRILVTDGPVLRQPHSTTGKKFQVERITIDYRLEGGSWVVKHAADVTLGGTVLKKDGTASKVDHSGGADFHDWKNRDEELPWLVEIINQLRPYGVPAAFHGELEVTL